MPLSDLRILDLADERGAYCAKLLADMGADVVRVEAAPGGDPLRAIGPFVPDAPPRERSLAHRFYNANKRGIVLDPRRDRPALLRLIDLADAVVVTGSPAHLRTSGLDYESLAGLNPRLVVAAITPFGLSGPWAEWRSCDTVAQALGGMMFVNGHPGEPPLRSLGLQAYHSASAYAAIGILLALLERRWSGRGQLIDVSLHEAVAASVEHVSSMFRQTGRIEERRGTLHWSRYFRVARCRDGYVLQSSLGDWTSLIEWVKADGKAEELGGAEWDDVDYRREHCVRLFDVLAEWARDYTVVELVEGAQLRRIPFAAVQPLERVHDDPQLRARGFFVSRYDDALERTIEYPGAPYVFSRTPWRLRRGAPGIGERPDASCDGWPRGVQSAVQPQPPHEPAARGGLQQRRAGGSPSPVSASALAGVRILDFTWVVAGPAATRILADHGAEVIKVERRDVLDFGGRRGGLTGNLNRGKRSVVIDMNDPRGVHLVRRMIERCDVVIDNFSARVMRNWGLDYDGLRSLKPDIIAVSMSGFGHSGPRKDYVSYGPTLQALAGFTLQMRHAEAEPAGWGFSYSDMAGGYTAALAVLTALWHREQTGEGQLVDLSQFEALTALIGPALLETLFSGSTTAPLGNGSPERPAAPHGVYRCRDRPDEGPARDRWCALAVFDEHEWERFVDVLGRPAWTSDPRFATAASRARHRDVLDARVEEWTRTQSTEAVMQRLQAAGVAAGIVANAEDLCMHDPQLRARGYWATVGTPEGEHVTLDGVPIHLSRTPGSVTRPGPLLGEDTDEVLGQMLGLEETAMAELKGAGVVMSSGGGRRKAEGG